METSPKFSHEPFRSAIFARMRAGPGAMVCPDPDKAPFVRTAARSICPDCAWPRQKFQKICLDLRVQPFFDQNLSGSAGSGLKSPQKSRGPQKCTSRLGIEITLSV
jgi:hypothetical protein